MLYSIDVRGVTIQALADHPAYFSVVIYPVAQEFCPGIENKVSCHLLINILELIMIPPHVVPCPGDHILLRLRNVGSSPSLYSSPSYIRVSSENTNRTTLLGKGGSKI